MEERQRGLSYAKVGQIIELVEKMSVLGGAADKEGLAYALGVTIHSLANPFKAAELLNFVTVLEDHIALTKEGRQSAQGNNAQRKQIFGKQISDLEPFSTILRALGKEPEMTGPSLLKLVKTKVPAARKWKQGTDREMLRTIINWAEFGNLLGRDKESGSVRPVGSTRS
ncbi:MAG: AAA-associated domain-containing protein [Conexivisphaerales archaeon]